MAKRKLKQLVMTFGHGGWRPGAGRKPSKRRNKRALHRKRPKVTRRCPVHVTLKVRREFSSLRTKTRCRVIRRAFVAACAYTGARIVDWSIQANHLHLIVEADDTRALSRAMQGFCVRVAKGLNRLLDREGSVFTERYHLRVLGTPREIRNARAYVIQNYRRHAAAAGRTVDSGWVDPCSSYLSLSLGMVRRLAGPPSRTTGSGRGGACRPGARKRRQGLVTTCGLATARFGARG